MKITDQLPEGSIPIGYVAAIKYLDDNGQLCLAHHISGSIPMWEARGMLLSTQEDLQQSMQSEG